MLGQIGVANIKIAEKRELGGKYQLRICIKDRAIQRQICWVRLEKRTPDVDLYCGLSNLNEHWSYHTSGDFHRKQTGSNSLYELGGKAGLVLMWATWKRQRLQEMESSEPILEFSLLLNAESLETFPIFKSERKYSDIVEIDLNTFAIKPNSVTMKLTAARRGNFFESIPDSSYFRRIFEFGNEKLWLIVDAIRN